MDFVYVPERKTNRFRTNHIVNMILTLKKSFPCIMIASIPCMRFCHVQIKTKNSGFSFDETYKLKFSQFIRYKH